MKKLIIINILIVILETIIIYEYLLYQFSEKEKENPSNYLRNAVIQTPTEPPAPPPYICPSCQFHEILEEKLILSLLENPSMHIQPLLFYSKLFPFTSTRLPYYPIYSTIPQRDVKNQRGLIFHEQDWNLEDIILPSVYQENKVSNTSEGKYIFQTVDCFTFYKICWKYQLNHHNLPLFLIFLQSNNQTDLNAYRMSDKNDVGISTISFRDFNPILPSDKNETVDNASLKLPEQSSFTNSSETSEHQKIQVPNNKETIPYDESQDEEKGNEFNSHALPPSSSKLRPSSLLSSNTTTSSPFAKLFSGNHTKDTFSHGRYFFLDSKTITELTEYSFTTLQDLQPPHHPIVIYLYNDQKKICSDYIRQYNEISQQINQNLLNHNHNLLKTMMKDKSRFRGMNYDEEIIPLIKFYAFNYHSFPKGELMESLQLIKLPTMIVLNLHKVKEKVKKFLIGEVENIDILLSGK